MYENTGARAHVMAAELIEAGVDVHGIYRRLYEGMPFAKLELLARALANVQRYDDGRLTFTHLTRGGLPPAGAEDSYSEGVIDHLRSVEGTKVAALVRELVDEAATAARRSPCARRTATSTSRSSRARAAGRAPPGGGLRDDALGRGARRVPARRGRRAALALQVASAGSACRASVGVARLPRPALEREHRRQHDDQRRELRARRHLRPERHGRADQDDPPDA